MWSYLTSSVHFQTYHFPSTVYSSVVPAVFTCAAKRCKWSHIPKPNTQNNASLAIEWVLTRVWDSPATHKFPRSRLKIRYCRPKGTPHTRRKLLLPTCQCHYHNGWNLPQVELCFCLMLSFYKLNLSRWLFGLLLSYAFGYKCSHHHKNYDN